MSRIISINLIILTLLSIILLFTEANANLRKESIPIFNQEMFSLDLKCFIPMLGQSFAEIQVDKKGTVIVHSNWAKILEDYKLPDNIETNPMNIKYLSAVYLKNESKVGIFWEEKSGQVNVTRLPDKYSDVLAPCVIWMRDIIDMSNGFKLAQPAELEEGEKKIGNKKFIFNDTEKRKIYGYIFQDDTLKGIYQDNGGDVLTKLGLVVNSYKTLNQDQFTKIPNGVEYMDY